MTAEVPLVRLDRVGRIFDSGAIVALRDVDLSIFPGDRVAIVGQSGSGKSTLINLMSGIDAPSSGLVYWGGQLVNTTRVWTALRASQIGIVFQDFHLLSALTALENVEIALSGSRLTAWERRRKALTGLEQVGLAGRAGHLPHALSGGERQRVAIARSIVNNPMLLFADEPTGNLDTANSRTVIDLIFEIQRRSASTLVLVTHDEMLASRCHRRIWVSDGRIVGEDQNAELRAVEGGRE